MEVMGYKVGPSEFGRRGVLVLDEELTGTGNVVLRVGHELRSHEGSGWERSEHVVLVPDEALRLAGAIVHQLGGVFLMDGRGYDSPELYGPFADDGEAYQAALLTGAATEEDGYSTDGQGVYVAGLSIEGGQA